MRIEREKKETIDIVKHGYRCESRCVLRQQRRCRGLGGECRYDLRSDFWKDYLQDDAK